MQATNVVRWLDDLEDADRTVVGGKVAELARLRRSGFPVPDGFAVTAEAFVATLRANGIEEEITRIADQVRDAAQAEQAEQRCRRMVAECVLPPEVVAAIESGYNGLIARQRNPRPQVAVRSSALREDQAEASSAGQYDSFLGVSGIEAVIDAVRRCWMSLFSQRALVYRARNGISTAASPMAVAVVELVEARSAGVAFSVHPVSGNPDRLTIESTFGWGESLVQGRVRPDRFEVDRDAGRILRRDIARKSWVSCRNDQGTIAEMPMPAVLADQPSLDDDEVRAITDVLLRVEAMLGYHVDMEWVWPPRASAPVVVQARPGAVHAPTPTPPPAATADPFAAALRYSPSMVTR